MAGKVSKAPNYNPPELKATEGRLNSIIGGWFQEQYPNKPPKETLARRIISSMVIMPDELFDWLNSL